MIYATVRRKIEPKQITWEEVLFDEVSPADFFPQTLQSTGTITNRFMTVPEKLKPPMKIETMINKLLSFNISHASLIAKEDKSDLYTHFCIPKKTGGLRPIDAPVSELQNALGELVDLLKSFGLLYHTSAFAYIKDRSIVDCLKRHQLNDSKWFLKTDFSGFFPNTTLDFTMKMLKMVYPLSEVCARPEGLHALRSALSLGFLNGGLPQGTKLSPFITNVLMIPIDFELFNRLAHRKIVYTRYADDMHISAQEKFPYKEIVEIIRDVLKMFDAPYVLKDEKTHFGSRAGRNWNLGLMLNKDNDITVGYRTKKQFKAMMTNFILDTIHEKPWPVEDVATLKGKLSYYKMIEPTYFERIVWNMERKWRVNVKQLFKTYQV